MVVKCSKCGNIIKGDDRIATTEDGEIICGRCKDTYYHLCSKCDRMIPNSANRSICMECDNKVYETFVNSYHTKPIPRFVNKDKSRIDKNNRYYGMELELSYVRPEYMKIAMGDLYKEKLIYNKSDGSLRGHGVEIVTNPCDKSSLFKLLDRMGDPLKDGTEGTNYKANAGIHFHVNRKSVSPITIYKISYLLNHRHSRDDRYKIYRVVGRINSFRSLNIDDRYFGIGICDIKDIRYCSSHSYAFNLGNTNTVEFRLFKSTNDVEEIKSYVEFVDLIISFCENNGLKDMVIDNLLLYIKNNTKNEILLKRIKSIERYYGKINNSVLKYNIDMGMFKGIPIENIYQICMGSNSIVNLQRNVELFKRNGRYETYVGAPYVWAGLGRIEKAYRASLIHNIKKGMEELECV